ncbi:MAG: hypothetical protein ACJ70Z_08025 [Nitrososphaera sp.]
MINNNNTPYLRNKTSTLFVLSTAIALLVISPLLPFSNPLLLLQPVRAQTLMSFRTLGQATGEDPATNEPVGLTFDANGTINNERIDITSGTIHLQAYPGSNGKIYNGTITRGIFFNESGGVPNFQLSAVISGLDYTVSSGCDTSSNNQFSLESGQTTVTFNGAVECSTVGGGNTASSSMTGTTTTQQDRDSNSRDSDGDGIPDSSDRCTHNSNPKCFKEGVTGTATQSSTSNRTGNQTR